MFKYQKVLIKKIKIKENTHAWTVNVKPDLSD